MTSETSRAGIGDCRPGNFRGLSSSAQAAGRAGARDRSFETSWGDWERILGGDGFEQVGLGGRHAAERVTGADFGDGALVAVYAAVVADLQEERAVAEPDAALDAFGAADA